MRTLLFLFVLACGGPSAPDLPAPWSPIAAATVGGTVEDAGDELHVRYDAAPSDLPTRWAQAYERAGYQVTPSAGSGGMMLITATREADRFDVLITRAGSRADVLVTRR